MAEAFRPFTGRGFCLFCRVWLLALTPYSYALVLDLRLGFLHCSILSYIYAFVLSLRSPGACGLQAMLGEFAQTA